MAGQIRDARLRILGSVGEPINPEAWRWYHRNTGKERCPIVDTWWQTETGGILITPLPGATPLKPGSATFPFFGVKPILLDAQSGEEIKGNGVSGARRSRAMARADAYDLRRRISASRIPISISTRDIISRVTGRRDEDGYYWITGRVDDVINVSGHRMGTAEVESAWSLMNSWPRRPWSGFLTRSAGEGIYAYVTLNAGVEYSEDLRAALKQQVREVIGPIATPDFIHWAPALPKTRSGKIMRRILPVQDRNR